MVIAQSGFSQYSYTLLDNESNPGNINTSNDDDPTWTEILSSGANQYSTAQSIPFPFSFDGNSVTAFKAASTGYITFDTTVSGTPPAISESIPSVNLPDNTICVWGLSLEGGNDKVFTEVFGTTPNRQLWVRWTSASTPGNPDSYNYFSIVLEESTNNIYIVDMLSDNLSTAYVPPFLTIGLQFSDTLAIQVSGSPNVTPINIGATNAPVDNDYYIFELINGDVDFCLITVDPMTLRNTLVWENSDPSIDSFNIYRSKDGIYQKIGSVPRDSLTLFVDYQVTTDYISSSYRIAPVYGAGQGALGSGHTTINLKIGPDSTWLYWNLYWNSYVGFDVEEYRILRDYYGNGTYQFYASIPGNENQYTDSVPSWFDSATYIIEIIPLGDTCFAGTGAEYLTVWSNPANVKHVGVDGRRPDQMDLKIYPNPSEGSVIVSTYFQTKKTLSLGLFDLLGRNIQQWEYLNFKGPFEHVFELKGLPKGMYLLKLQTADQLNTVKLILE